VAAAARSIGSGAIALCAALSLGLAADKPPAPERPVLERQEQSENAPLASHSMLLDAAYAGSRIVVVGERGHILLSDDQGAGWRQAPVPTLSTLTALYFADASHGWAVGHDEVILRTEDAGEHWSRVHFAPEAEHPLLDVWFRDADHGLAIGAYSAYYTSADGGRTWQSQTFAPILRSEPTASKAATAATKPADDEGMQYHLNGIAAASSGKLYLAAEAGHLYRSDDGGATWLTLKSPYEGSFFGVLPLDGDALLAFGLRGHLYRSENAGTDWTEIATGVHSMLTSALRLPHDCVAVTGLAGVLLVSGDGGHTFRIEQQPDRKGMSSALLVGERLLTVGENGVVLRTLALPPG
jgi:photosystem II stability/assembly factor-like uncharacterized protein